MNPRWVRTFEHGIQYVEDVEGISWADAPTPRWLHRCAPQTRAWLRDHYTQRCSCGAARNVVQGRWTRKNEVRRHACRDRLLGLLPHVPATCGRCSKTYKARLGTRRVRGHLCDKCWATMFMATAAR